MNLCVYKQLKYGAEDCHVMANTAVLWIISCTVNLVIGLFNANQDNYLYIIVEN